MAAPDGIDTTAASDPQGATDAVPTGTNAVIVYSDPRCPWAHVAVHRMLAAVERRGLGSELVIDHRWFPLGDDAMPTEPEELDRKLDLFRSLEPDLDWHRWSSGGSDFPAGSRLAASWVQAAKQDGPAASQALDRALRSALFADGRDISDPAVVEQVASAVDGLDVDEVRTEVASGRPDAELDRQAELAGSDLVPVSPTVVLSDGTHWANPGITSHAEDGGTVVDADDRAVAEEIIDAYLAQRHYD